MIPKPELHIKDPYKDQDPYTTRLIFKNQPACNFYMYGGVAWPKTIVRSDNQAVFYPGFLLMAGQVLEGDLRGNIWLFEEQEFRGVDTWLKSDGNPVEYPGSRQGFWLGLGEFVKNCYAKYGCRSYFWDHRQYEVYHTFMLDMQESLQAKRMLYPMEPHDLLNVEELGNQVVSEYVQMKKVQINENSRMAEFLNSPDQDENNGVHCLKCLLVGFKQVPYVDLRLHKTF